MCYLQQHIPRDSAALHIHARLCSSEKTCSAQRRFTIRIYTASMLITLQRTLSVHVCTLVTGRTSLAGVSCNGASK